MLERTVFVSVDFAKEAEYVEAGLREIEVNEGEIAKDEAALMMSLQLLADFSYIVWVVHHILEGEVQQLPYFLFPLRNGLLCKIQEQGFALHLILREELQNP